MKQRCSTQVRAMASAGLVIAISFSSQVLADGEVKAFTQQTSTTSCTFKTMQNWDNMCQAFYSEVASSSSFFGDGHTNDSGNSSLFTDPDHIAGGVDNLNLDDADVAIACLHGSDQGANGWRGSFRNTWNGATNCSARRQDMSLGEVDLEQLFLSSCHSMNKDDTNVWNDGANPTANGVQGTHGFHGIMYISSGETPRYEDAADDAVNVTIRTGWLSLFSDDWNGPGGDADDQCPITVAWGDTEDEAMSRLDYNLVDSLNDSDNPVANWRARLGILGCDPAGKGPF
jgi:hypothetical protein